MPIPMFSTFVAEDAARRVSETLASTFLSEGAQVQEFEAALQRTLGMVHPVALNSGTAALHLALVLAGVRQGDEVILPAQTFIASGLAVAMQGATPVFADIQYETGNIDPAGIAAKITSRTKAIMPVHWAGNPCDMDEIGAVAASHGLAVIEDAAHALGAIYRSRPIGSISQYTCFSFQAIKHVTTGDGGVLCTRDAVKAKEAFRRRWFGIDRAGSPMSKLGERQYDVADVGFKYHLNDYAAALGIANLAGFPERLRRYRAIADAYRQAFKDTPGITLFRQDADRESACWIFGMHVERRDDFVQALAARQIPCSVVHTRIDHNSIFGGLRNDLPQQERFDMTQIHLPCHMHMTDDHVQEVIEGVRNGW
jgi:perosamine synthetase